MYLRTHGYKRRRIRLLPSTKALHSSLTVFKFQYESRPSTDFTYPPLVSVFDRLLFSAPTYAFAPYRLLHSQATRRALSLYYGTTSKGMLLGSMLRQRQ